MNVKKRINVILFTSICIILFIEVFSNLGQVYAAVSVGTQEEWLMAIEAISEEILSDGDWTYSSSGSETKKSYKTARETNCHKTNCALFVSHALQYFEVFSDSMTFYGGENGLVFNKNATKRRLNNIATIKEYDKEEVKLSDIKSELQAGDIITFYKVHTCIYLGEGRYATAGKSSTDTKKEGGTLETISKSSPGCTGYISTVIRLNYSTEDYSDSDDDTTSSSNDTEGDTFTGALGSTFRQFWVFLATVFENHANETDEETVFYNLNESSSAGAGNGDILASCEAVMNLILPTDSYYSQATPPLVRGDIEKQFNTATTTSTGFCCTTYVAMVLYYSGVLTADQINSCNYHQGESLTDMLLANGWTEVSVSEIQPGDVVRDPGVHTFIYAGNGQVWDECCCITSSSGNPPNGTTRSRSVSGCKVYRAP